MKKFLNEFWTRWKEPLNTWWRNALYIFGTIGTMAIVITEIILPVLVNPEVSHELKDFLRPFYGWCIGIASAARLTTANQAKLDFEKKLKQAQEEQPKQSIYEPEEIVAYRIKDSDTWVNSNNRPIDLSEYEISRALRTNTQGIYTKAVFTKKLQ